MQAHVRPQLTFLHDHSIGQNKSHGKGQQEWGGEITLTLAGSTTKLLSKGHDMSFPNSEGV